jgi:SAM-dependent methyltransferase
MRELFTAAYETHTAPWVIGEPQPAIVELERSGVLHGRILDVGCGLGEHTILLTRLGYDVRGIDYVAEAIAQAGRNARDKGVDARFELADALDLPADPRYDAIVDSALFHIFSDDDRMRYVASLDRACAPGGRVFVLALSDAGRGFGPQVSEQTIRSAFGAGWELESLDTATYRGVVGQAHADPLGVPVGTVVDEPAWLATVRHR